MLGRPASGATIAALPLAVALTAFAQGWTWVGVIFSLGVVAILTVTFAPELPVLHALPAPVGAPKVKFAFRVVEMASPATSGMVIEVGVRPSTRLDDAVVNFQFPSVLEAYDVWEVEPGGRPSSRGVTLPPDYDTPSPIRWWAYPDDLRASSKVFYFAISPGLGTRPFNPFKVTMLVMSEKLYGNRASADYEVQL